MERISKVFKHNRRNTTPIAGGNAPPNTTQPAPGEIIVQQTSPMGVGKFNKKIKPKIHSLEWPMQLKNFHTKYFTKLNLLSKQDRQAKRRLDEVCEYAYQFKVMHGLSAANCVKLVKVLWKDPDMLFYTHADEKGKCILALSRTQLKLLLDYYPGELGIDPKDKGDDDMTQAIEYEIERVEIQLPDDQLTIRADIMNSANNIWQLTEQNHIAEAHQAMKNVPPAIRSEVAKHLCALNPELKIFVKSVARNEWKGPVHIPYTEGPLLVGQAVQQHRDLSNEQLFDQWATGFNLQNPKNSFLEDGTDFTLPGATAALNNFINWWAGQLPPVESFDPAASLQSLIATQVRIQDFAMWLQLNTPDLDGKRKEILDLMMSAMASSPKLAPHKEQAFTAVTASIRHSKAEDPIKEAHEKLSMLPFSAGALSGAQHATRLFTLLLNSAKDKVDFDNAVGLAARLINQSSAQITTVAIALVEGAMDSEPFKKKKGKNAIEFVLAVIAKCKQNQNVWDVLQNQDLAIYASQGDRYEDFYRAVLSSKPAADSSSDSTDDDQTSYYDFSDHSDESHS